MKLIDPAELSADEEVMNYKGLAVYLKMSAGSLRHKVMKNEIPFLKIDGAVRFSKKHIDAWLEEHLRKSKKNKSINKNDMSAGCEAEGNGG